MKKVVLKIKQPNWAMNSSESWDNTEWSIYNITLGRLIISLILICNADGEKIKNKVLCFATWFLFFCNFLICSYGFFVPTVKIHVDTLALISLISVLVELFFLRISIKIKERNEYNLIFEKTSMIFISVVYVLFFILWIYN